MSKAWSRVRCIHCPASGCERTELFEVTLTVDCNRHVAESLRKIPAAQFTCTTCGGDAADSCREVPDSKGENR